MGARWPLAVPATTHAPAMATSRWMGHDMGKAGWGLEVWALCRATTGETSAPVAIYAAESQRGNIMSIRTSCQLVLLSGVFATSALAQAPEHSAHHKAPMLGSVNFRNSGSKAAQAAFQRGVAWLHNFKYKEAASAFREAQRADPSLAAAYWLEALSYSQVLWGVENLARSTEALSRLAPTPALRLAKAKTPAERGFGAAVEAFYATGPLVERTRAYSDSLLALAARDSTDLEIAAFASHGAMVAWSVAPPAERPKLTTTARTLALRVYNVNPNHPGAVHYLTHVADMDPRSARDLLTFARAYDKIAPDADHALHMPSHVYLPLGLWPEVSSSNERAWAASRAEVAHEKASQATLSWHSLEWLQYGYLEEGRWTLARSIIDTARATLRGVEILSGNPDARFAVNVLAFTYGMETGDWTAWPPVALDVSALFAMPTPTQRAWAMTMTNAYQATVAEIQRGGNLSHARAVAKRFREIADTTAPDMRRRNLSRLAGQLEALIARAEGDVPRAIATLRPLAEVEQAFASTPPTSVPTHELLGEMLLQANQPGEAAAAYRAALEVRPNRSRALLGLARSLRASGDHAGAEEALKRLALNWKRADAKALTILEDERGRR